MNGPNLLMREWWRQCVLRDTQLLHSDQFLRGADYLGEGPWYDAVLPEALRLDFQYHTDHHNMVTGVFMKKFKNIAGVELRYATRRTRRLIRPRVFVLFPSKPSIESIDRV